MAPPSRSIIINDPLSLYNQLASFCFLLAGNFTDILLVRLCLSGAYICLLSAAVAGSPLWPHLWRQHHLSVDGLCWGVICLYVHLCGVSNLLRDERSVQFTRKGGGEGEEGSTEEDEALWRMLYRMGGISRLQFKDKILPQYVVRRYKYGTQLPTDTHFHIIYRGFVRLEVLERGDVLYTFTYGSGALFDFK